LQVTDNTVAASVQLINKAEALATLGIVVATIGGMPLAC